MTEHIKEDGLLIRPTGRAVIVVDLEGYGPMEFRINDQMVLYKVIGVLLDSLDGTLGVDSYKAAYGKTLKKILEADQ